MNRFLLRIIGISFLAFCSSVLVLAQDTKPLSPPNFEKGDDKEPAKGMRAMLYKMQIEKEKKDFQEMLDRGEQVDKLTAEVAKSVEAHGSLTEDDKRRIDDVEKLVKKIRGELGGSDDDDTDADAKPKDVVSGVKYLRDSTTKLVAELKQSSRFTVSAAAIEASNTVLKGARFLRFGN